MGNFIDMTGWQFGRLTVVKRGPDYITPGGHSHVMWFCKCSCGNPELRLIRGTHLRSGATTSCGCYMIEKCREAGRKSATGPNRYEFKGDYVIGYTYLNEPFYFDTEDFDLVSKYRWHRLKATGAIAAWDKGNGKQILLHRLVMHAKDGEIVDHINHQEEMCCKRNLRIVTKMQNSHNAGLQKNNTSGVTGVYWDKKSKKWFALIQKDRIMHHLGMFTDKNDAIAARKVAEEKYFGEYSYDNSMAAVPRLSG